VFRDNLPLLWRPADAQASDWHVLDRAPAANFGFTEVRRYIFQHPSLGWSLYIDDEPLERVPGQSSSWEWQPGFFAGEVTAELQRPDGGSAGLYLLDVAPDPDKVGQQIFAEMVRELWNEDPTLVIGAEPATTATGELGVLQDPWVAFARFRRYTPEFLRALVRICRCPRRTLQVRRDSAPLHQVRRIDQQTLTSVLRSPAIAMVFAHPDDAPAAAPDSRVDVPVVQDTVDADANRAMLALILALIRRGQTLLERLQTAVDREVLSETRTPLVARWPTRRQFLQNATMQFGNVLRRFPFQQVRRPEITAAGLTAIASDPIYSRAWGRGWRALRAGFESEMSTERLWVSPTWEIYERWCFLRLGKLLALSTPSWRWSLQHHPRRWVGVGSDAHAEFLLQPTFRAHSSRQEGKWSISRERVPDLVLVVERRGAIHFLVLDAKYRTSRPAVLEAMESAHIYQDSLRWGGRRPDATLLIVPSVRNTDWLAAPAFQAEHRVGAFPLSPGATAFLPKVILGAFEA
jgi:hypothetical protein